MIPEEGTLMLKLVNDCSISYQYYDVYYVHVMLMSYLRPLYIVVVVDFYLFVGLITTQSYLNLY